MTARPGRLTERRPLDSPLSPRELECLTLAADGSTNAEIGRKLFISPDTVKHHLESANDKLGSRNRTDACVRAVRRGLLPAAG